MSKSHIIIGGLVAFLLIIVVWFGYGRRSVIENISGSEPLGMKRNLRANVEQSVESKGVQAMMIPESREGELSRIAKEKGFEIALAQAKNGDNRESDVKFVLLLATLSDAEFVARELRNSGLSITGMDAVVDGLMSKWPDPMRALNWAEGELTGGMKNSAISLALARIVKYDVQFAIGYLEKMPAGGDRNRVFSSIFSTWASVDVTAAIAYARKSLEPGDFSSAMIDVAPAWVAKDINGAKAYFKETAGNSESAFLGHLIGVEMMKSDPTAAIKWLSAQEGVAAERAKRSAVISWVDTNPQAASSYVNSMEPATKDKLAPILAGAWAENDPAAAAAWVAGCKEESLQGKMTLQLLHRWQATDAPAAAEWLSSLPDGPVKKEGMDFLNARDSVPLNKRYRIHPELYIEAADDAALFSTKSMCGDCGVIHPSSVHQ